MKTRSFAVAVIAVLLLNFVSFAGADTRRVTAKTRQVSRLVTLLPASDGIAVFDAKRFFGNALPQLVSANQPVLGEVMAAINEMENRTGIDLRKFDQLAVGVAFRQISPKETDFEPVAIASGDIGAGALIAIAKLASNGTYREEKIGDRTVYVFSAKVMIQKTAATTTNSKIAGYIDRALKGLTKDVAVTAIDSNTLAIGTLARIRETLSGQSHVSPVLTAMLSQKESTLTSFAARPPGGMSKMLPLGDDELGTNIDSIQYLSGSVEVSTAGAELQLMARTKKPEQAQGLKDTLDGLQLLGKAVLGGSKKPDQQLYGRLVKNAKFDLHGSDVTLDLLVPQADIDALIAGIK